MEKKERKIVRASDGKESVKKTVKKADQEAEEIVEETPAEKKMTKEEKKKSATVKRVIACVLWALALCCELMAILVINEKIKLPFFSTHDDVRIALWLPLIIFIVLDLACCLIAAFLWKKSNRLDPIKKTGNQVGFVILTQLGVIMAVLCFLPLIILILVNKKLDKKTKAIFTIVAIVALLLAGLLGADWNPISKEEAEAAETAITGDVYWTQYGRKYHTDQDCQTIRNSDLLVGTVEEAIEANRETLCAFCAKHDNIDTTNMKVEERSDVE